MYSEIVRVTVAREMALRRNQPMPCFGGGLVPHGRLIDDMRDGESHHLQDVINVVRKRLVLDCCE